MKRLLLLLLPVATLGVGVLDLPNRQVREEAIGRLWQASITAEANGDAIGASDKLNAYTTHGGDPFMGRLRAGWLNLGERMLDQAARDYAAAAKLQPNALSPLLGLLSVAQAKNDGAATMAAAEAVLLLEPTNSRALLAVAWSAFQAKDYPRSAAAYQQVLALYPENTDAISGAAWCAFHTGRKREANEGFHRLLAINPSDPYVRQGIAATGG